MEYRAAPQNGEQAALKKNPAACTSVVRVCVCVCACLCLYVCLPFCLSTKLLLAEFGKRTLAFQAQYLPVLSAQATYGGPVISNIELA